MKNIKTLVLSEDELKILQFALYLDIETIGCAISSGEIDTEAEDEYEAIEKLLQKITDKLRQ